jgi:hypothetical protein
LSADKEVVADEIDEKPELSIREELEAARDEVVARQEKDNVVSTDESVSARQSEPDPTARVRGPDGKFVRQSDGGTGGELAAASSEVRHQAGTAGNNPQTGASGAQGSVQPVALPAPNGWKAEEKALWAKVPPEVQHVIANRERDVARKISEQDEVRLVGNNFMQAANEFAPVIQARGGNPVALFREVLGIISQIHNSPPANRAQLFRQLAAQNGADLSALGIPPGQNAPNTPPNVPIDQLVSQRVNEQFQAIQRQQAQERERAEMQAVNSEIETFRSTVDAQGHPAYPYFDHVNSLMAALLEKGTASTLEEAYKIAVKAHPETSALITQAEQAKVKQAEEARRKAEAARRKSGSLRTGPGSPPVTNGAGNRTIRDELKAAFEEARGRV